MPLAEPERIREDFHHNVRRDTPLDYYSGPLKTFLKQHAGPEHLGEILALVEHDCGLLLLAFEAKHLGSVSTLPLSQAAKNHLAVLASSEKALSRPRGALKPPKNANGLGLANEGPHLAEQRSFLEKIVSVAEKYPAAAKNPNFQVSARDFHDWLYQSEARQKQVLQRILKNAKNAENVLARYSYLKNSAAAETNRRLYSAYKKAAGID